jgi:hypothetical protein
MDRPADFSTRIARNELRIDKLEEEIAHCDAHGASSALLRRVELRLVTENELLRAWNDRPRRDQMEGGPAAPPPPAR